MGEPWYGRWQPPAQPAFCALQPFPIRCAHLPLDSCRGSLEVRCSSGDRRAARVEQRNVRGARPPRRVHGGALDQAHAGLLAAPSSLPGQPAWDPAPTAQPAAALGHSLWLPYLLAHHAPVDCLLLDQLALGDALHAAPLALPAADAPLPPAIHAAGRASTPHIALFHARGPQTGMGLVQRSPVHHLVQPPQRGHDHQGQQQPRQRHAPHRCAAQRGGRQVQRAKEGAGHVRPKG